MALNRTPPRELRIFTNKLGINQDGSRIFLRVDDDLQTAIAARWEDIVAAYPRLIVTEDIVGKIVRELFVELQDQLEATQKNRLIEKYWLSFLFSTALSVSSKMSRTIGLSPTAVREACIGSIGNLYVFYKTYKNTKSDRRLLSDLKSYAYNKIKNSSYPDLRFQFSDDTIGRGNPGMITKYESSIADALRWVEKDESTNEILSETTIERKVSLCKWTIEYVKEQNKKKDPGAKKLQINELKLSDFKKICKLYCDNTSEFEYLRKINQDVKNKKEKLTIKDLDSSQKAELEKLRRKLHDNLVDNNLPQAMEDELDNIGAIIRRFIKRDKSISIDTPIGTDDEGFNLGYLIESSDIPPGRTEENLDLDNILQSEISSYYHNLIPRDKKMLYLWDSFDLKQEPIELIIVLDQANISKRLSKIYLEIQDFSIDKIKESNPHLDRQDILEIVVDMLGSNCQSRTVKANNSCYYEDLSPLIKKYTTYFQYLKESRRQYPKLAKTLKEIRTQQQKHAYAQQFDYLATLSPEQYPKLRPELNMSSFLTLIEEIQNILEEKIQDSSDKLWN